jgi:hypothetical protein
VAAVRFHGAVADEEFVADFLVRFVLGHQTQDAAFLLVESVLLKLLFEAGSPRYEHADHGRPTRNSIRLLIPAAEDNAART